MNPEEYAQLERLEAAHWYYVAKRRTVRHWLLRTRPPAPDDELLDCGAGTGRFAAEMQRHCRVRVLDDHEESLARLRTRFTPERVLRPTDAGIPLPDASLDYLTALDVLEHLADDRAAVRDWARVLRPGGCCVVTVPAGMALWSDWDEALHHYRRYDRRGLLACFDAAAWEIVHCAYTNVLVYPAVWAVRRWRRLFPAAPGARAEDRLPPAPLNTLLRWAFEWPARSRLPFPAGVSLLLVSRRRGAPH